MPKTRQICTFKLADLFLGVDTEIVQEVLRPLVITPVPLAPQTVQGLINLRGQIVTGIDLRRRLELPVPEKDRACMNVVVRTRAGPVSLLVDEIGDVLEVDEDSFEGPPDTLPGSTRELIKGAYKLDGALLLLLAAERVVELRDRPPGSVSAPTEPLPA